MRIVVLSFLFILTTLATTPVMSIEPRPEIKFDLKKANQQFDQIKFKLSGDHLNLPDLENAIETLQKFNHQAEKCVSDAQKKIDDLNELLMQNSSLSKPEKHSVDLVYLDDQKKGLASHQAECRLFSIRAQEAIDAYKIACSNIVKKVTFTREAPLWSGIDDLTQHTTTLLQLGQLFYLLGIIMLSLGVIYYGLYYFRQSPIIQRNKRLIVWTITAWLFICALLDIAGYHLLARNLTFSSALTCIIALMSALLFFALHHVYLSLYVQPKLLAWVSHYIGYKKDHVYVEFLILKVILQILVISTGIYLIGESMDFSAYYIEELFSEILDGIHVASVIIYPARILIGLVLFCVLFLMCRGISTSIIRHQEFADGEETQVALASILTYIGFTFALISGLVVAGFNFTGLAIIAGALSVGIGLGLQSIVNNFVSGLILLIEKPIRPGDRICVDGAEGFVKKIRIRSTQIITPKREDIIIPNSDLITRRVTNYMFSDKNCRISCDVGVAYGSDTHLVRETLLQIANQHDDVVKTGASKPVVLFRSFGENNLMFQLWCLIKDVNKNLIVQSDLHFAIDEAFRKLNISMAYPQRDLHVTLSNRTHTPQKL